MKRIIIAAVLACGLMAAGTSSARASGCGGGPGFFSIGLTFSWNFGGGCGCGPCLGGGCNYPCPQVYSAPPPYSGFGYGDCGYGGYGDPGYGYGY